MKTELQYNLQKARALATELRCTLDWLADEGFEHNDENLDWQGHVNQIESTLDEMDLHVIGEGSVKLTVEPHR